MRIVPVSELLKTGAQLIVPVELEISENNALNGLSKKVELLPLENVANLVSGISVRSEDVTSHPVDGALPLLRISDLSEGTVRIGERYWNPSRSIRPLLPDQHIRRGDVLISINGTIGKVQYVRAVFASSSQVLSSPEGLVGIAQKGLVILRPRNASLDARFLAAMLASDTLQALMRRLSRGVVIAHLPINILRKIRIPIPPTPIQERVLRRLEAQPGDALEALILVLADNTEDPLLHLFRNSPALSRLTGDAVPETSELQNLTFEALNEFRQFRNKITAPRDNSKPLPNTNPTDDITHLMILLGAIPIHTLRQGGEAFFEAASAMRAIATTAEPIAKRIPSTLGRYVTRLIEWLARWEEAARADLLTQVQLTTEHDGLDFRRDAKGVPHTKIRVTLRGTIPLRNFIARVPDLLKGAIYIGEIQPDKPFDIDLEIPDNLQWQGHESGGGFRRPLYWSAEGPDGGALSGESEAQIWFTWTDWGGTGPFEPAPDTELAPKTSKWLEYENSPYVAGDVVDDPGMFFGRKSLLTDIQTHINGGTKVILLEGNRRTGKTSILRQIQKTDSPPNKQQWLMVESSLQGTVGDKSRSGISTREIFRMLIRDIGFACARAGFPVELPQMPPSADIGTFRFNFAKALNNYIAGIDPYEALQIFIDTTITAIAPRRLLLMLDEFDKLQVGIDNGVTSPQVPENIRNLLQTRPSIAAIIAGSRRLKRLREDYWSALFGIGHRIGVDPLTATEVAELITRPVKGRLEFTTDTLQLIAQLTARQPYLVQSLCAHIFELAKRHSWRIIRVPEVNEAAAQLVHDNEHFHVLWTYAESERRRYILWLCHRLTDEPHRVNAALLTQRLEEAGLIIPVDMVDDDLKFLIELEILALNNTTLGPQYEVAVPLMRRWMNKNVDAEAQRRRAIQEAQRRAS
ncbi:restriction endonuclease subunit S [Corallococcus sp. bb12-1]|uniref:restriction endonuclease subunit S n=1 Tax=Corallococcus sp. bb12-1 TaxID=2996784 RepID=UPI0022711B00|nr:restriction endonuclease subunit S [Corallococcus sp. bb12-1]MCY1043852.1 restriction endonuclease subunit S [Corallococcus sp. bb12-1]